jgi:Domain of unknown function (DUF1707)
MASNPSIRASDSDRDRTAQLLREHHAAGRLDPEEFADRLDRAFAAKTIDELDDLTSDLPAIDLYPLPDASLPKRRGGGGLPSSSVARRAEDHLANLRSPGWVAAWGSWSAVMLVCLVLWTVSTNAWPLLWAGAAGVLVAGGRIISRRSLGPGAGRRGQISHDGHDEIESAGGEG